MNSSSLLFDDLDYSDDERVERDDSSCLNLDKRAAWERAALLLLRHWLPFAVGFLSIFLKVNFIQK